MLLVVRSLEKAQGRGECREGLRRTATVERVCWLKGYRAEVSKPSPKGPGSK